MNSMNSTVTVYTRHLQSLLRKDLPPLRGSLLLPVRLQGALLIGCVYKTQCSYSWRSRPAFLQADFHARQKSPQECFLFTWKYDKMQGSNHYYAKLLNIDFAEYKEALKMCAFENT